MRRTTRALTIALLAAWCVGRPYKVGPATLVPFSGEVPTVRHLV